MKVTTENVNTREVVLTVEPDAERVSRAKRRAASAISRMRPVPGFRPGKAPLSMVERIFGAETVLKEALNSVAGDIFQDAVREADIEPYDSGQFEIESLDPLQLKINVSLRPVVDLGDYRSLRVEPEPEVAVTDEMVNEEIDALREEAAEYEPVERPVLMGDQVVLEMSAAVDDETVFEQDAFEILVNHEDQPIMLVETLLGMNAGESAERDMGFPDEYPQPELAGQFAHVRLTVKQVREKVLPEVDDEFAKSAGDYESADELRDKIREDLRREMVEARETRQRDKVVKALVEHAAIEYPAAAVDRELGLMIEQEQSRLRSMGFEWENYLRMIHRTEAEIRDSVRPRAEERLKQRLVLSSFAEAEGLGVDQDAIDEELSRLASAYGGDDAEGFRERMLQSGVPESIRSDLLGRKTIEHLVALLTGQLDTAAGEVTEGPPPAAEDAAGGASSAAEADSAESADPAPAAEPAEPEDAQQDALDEQPQPEPEAGTAPQAPAEPADAEIARAEQD